MHDTQGNASNLTPEQWLAIQTLFDATVEQPAAERAAYLTARCPDTTIRAQVWKLIEADTDSQAVLDRMAHGVKHLLNAPQLPPTPPTQGERYRDRQWLGAGGMAVVYRAHDSLLGRNVALKMLSPMLGAEPTARARFFSEAKAVSQLDHPNICTVYDLGEEPGGELFIAMALYEGETLGGALERGPFAFEQAIALTRQIARGLQYAHGQAIVHRDIKPSNLFVTEHGVAKILDFGIAKLADAELTQAGEVVGTLRYASPEQLAGKPVDHRTDIWSLGAVLHEMLEGRPAFKASSPAELVHKVALGQRPQLKHTAPGCRAAANRLLGAMLAPDRDSRYASVSALLAALDDTPSVTVVSPSPPTAATLDAGTARAQLRQGTAVVVDLLDMPRLQSVLDAEQMHALLHRFADTLKGVADRYGGRIHQQLGESVSMLFGVPLARGNDMERALRAACDARASIEALGEELGHPLAMRAGVATGEFMSEHGHRLSDLTASFVSKARALAASPEVGPGEIWMTAEVHAALRRHMEAEIRPDPTGRETPDSNGQGNAYRLERLVGDTGTRDEHAIPFVGRRAELRQLEGVLEECRESGTGQVVLLQGEAGMGKTRLGDEFARLARERGCGCHTTRVYDFGVPRGQDTVAVLTHGLLDLDVDAPAAGKVEVLAEVIASAVARAALADDSLVFALELLGLQAPPAQAALYEAMDSATRERGKHETLNGLLRYAARHDPVVVRVEDIHWARAETAGALRDLVATANSCPLIVLLTSRPHDPAHEDGQTWRERTGDTPLLTLDLAPLRPAEAKQLVQAFDLANQPVEDECLARAGGNPLFLEQLLRNAAAQTPDAALPASVRSLVLARMDRLAPLDREALQLAALLGQRFALEDLADLLDAPDYGCERLIEQRLVRRDAGAYLFAHALIQETAYSSLPPSARRTLHARHAERVSESDPALAAEHLDRAGDPRAAGAYLKAAVHANETHRYEQVLIAAERGLELSAAPAADVASALRLLKGDSLRELGRANDSVEAFNNALELASTDLERSRALLGIAAGQNLNDNRDAALQALKQAEAIADETAQLDDLSRLHYLRGAIGFASGTIEACSTSHGHALVFARRARSPLLEARALSGLGDAEYARGRMRKAFDYFEHCLALCEEHGLGQVEAANRFMLGTVRIYLNQLDRALEDALGSATMAARVGHKRAEIVSRLTCGWIYIARAEFDQAETQATAGLKLAIEIGARRFEPFLNESIARIQLARGERTAAQSTLADAMVVCRETGLAFIGPWVLATQALVSEDENQIDACLAEGARLLAGGCVGHNYFRFYQTAMELALERAHWTEARAYAQALERYTEADPVPWSSFYIDRARALASAGEQHAVAAPRLDTLREQALEAGLLDTLPAIERALRSLEPRGA